MVGGFALLTLILSMAGTYGVLAVLAEARRREIAIRMTLGSTRRQVARLILRQGLGPVFLGIILGAAGALISARLLQSLLYGVTATDPLVLATATLVLITMAVLSMLPPSLKAASVDPLETLRHD